MALVTLISDFGTRDGYAGAMKGVILTRCPDAQVIDITHDVPQYDVAAGAFCLAQSAPYFPDGTIHVVVVDPGVGSKRRAVIADSGTSLFVGPDNGVLAWAVPSPVAVHAIEAAEFMRSSISPTFHGRDIFAAAAGTLARGKRAAAAGPKTTLGPLPNHSSLSRSDDGALLASVVHIDSFGNLITNVPGSAVSTNIRVEVAGREIRGLAATFADVEPGRLLTYVGSAKTLEIAVREDSAMRVLGVAVGTPVVIRED